MHPQSPGPQGQQPPYGGAPTPAAAPNPAQNAGIAVLVCGVLILFASFSHGWFSMSEHGVAGGIGLQGAEVCGMGQCMEVGWGDMGKDVPGDIEIWGLLGFLGGLASAGACAVAGGMALTRNTAKIPIKLLQYPLVAASAAAGAFFVRVLTTKDAPSISYGGFLFVIGLVGAGYVMKSMLQPLVQSAALALPPGPAPQAYPQQMPQAGQPPMSASPMAAPSACPRCRGPIEYVAQYQRYFCRNCNQYV